jgi:putative ABC transport system ATP-binding protein
VTIGFPSQRFTAIMGPSGSGKSTLMQCVTGLDRLTSGSAFIGETDISTLSKTELALLRRDRLGFIFQHPGDMTTALELIPNTGRLTCA